MNEIKSLSYLLDLLNDPDKEVQDHAIEKLINFSGDLEEEILKNEYILSDNQKNLIQEIILKNRKSWVKKIWRQPLISYSHIEKIEHLMKLIIAYQYGKSHFRFLPVMLNELMDEYLKKNNLIDPFVLSDFLFRDKNFVESKISYSNIYSNNLIHVISEKKGTSFSLCCIYILLAHRLEIKLDICQLTGMFYPMVQRKKKIALIDCYHKGSVIFEDKIHMDIPNTPKKQVEKIKKTLLSPVLPESMMCKIIQSTMIAYLKLADIRSARLFYFMLKHNQKNETKLKLEKEKNIDKECAYKLIKPRFHAGQIVLHKQHGYRGVIVDYDLSFQADTLWYYVNPDKSSHNQPWYHVFVDGNDHSSYIPQVSLEKDYKFEKIYHPLIPYFFESFQDGWYQKNDNPWPGI